MASRDENHQPLVETVQASSAVVANSVGAIYQNAGKALPPPFQVPPQIAKFTGREKELTEVEHALVNRNALVSVCGLWGMGGIGKSALAIQATHHLHQKGCFPDGILWADLGASEVSEIVGGFIRAFGFDEEQIPKNRSEKIQLLRGVLKEKQLLIGLDNVQNAEQVIDLLPNTPSVAVIITSRKRLLRLNEYASLTRDLNVFSPDDSILLLKKYVESSVKSDPVSAARICELAGHLPLAVAIAGARLSDVRRWSALSVFVKELDDEHHRLEQFQIGEGEDRNLRAVFDVSFRTLPDELREVFCYLSLFGASDVGSSGIMALMQMDKQDAIGSLENLIDLSLLMRSNQGGYRLHDLLRIFAEERLIANVKDKGLLAAKQRLNEYVELQTEAFRLGGRAATYSRRGKWSEAVSFFEQALRINEKLEDRNGLSSTLGGLASVYSLIGASAKAIEYYRRSLELNEQIGNQWEKANTLGGLGAVYAQLGEWRQAIQYYDRARSLQEELRDNFHLAQTLGGLASIYAQRGDTAKAIELFERSDQLNELVRNHLGQASSLGGLASIYARMKEWDKAKDYYERAQALNIRVGNLTGQASALGGLAAIYSRTNDLLQAKDCYEQAQRINQVLGDIRGQASAYGGLAAIYARLRKWEDSIANYDLAQELNEQLGDKRRQASALGGLGYVYLRKGEWDQAIKYYLRAQTINEELGDKWGKIQGSKGLGEAYNRKKDWDRSIGSYQEALKLTDENNVRGQILMKLAYVYNESGRLNRAANCAREALPFLRGSLIQQANTIIKSAAESD